MPTANSRVHEFCFRKTAASAEAVAAGRMAGDPEPRETITRWRVNRLLWVKDALSHAIPAQPDRWAAEAGVPAHRGFRCWSGDVEVDVRSPVTRDAFHSMSFAEQIDFLHAWSPEPGDWDGAVREGLAATLQGEVAAQPLPFFENASRFTGLDPVYASAVVRGLSEGLKGKTVSSWESFWTFARWILAQPDPEAEIQDGFSGRTQPGRRWQTCRLEIARFLDATLNGELAALLTVERASVWELIVALTRDPNPAPADEACEGKCSMDPLAFSLNTVRGEAVHAVFSYIHWIRSRAPEAPQAGRNLDDVPEAREVLEASLDPQFEPSLAIRSIFGANLVQLAFWADAWLGDHLDQIFPAGGHGVLCGIAWDTFVRCSHPSPEMFARLRPQYAAAIARMSQNPIVERRHNDARVSLGQHLVVNFCRGDHDLEQPGDLLEAFFVCAPEAVRAEVLAFVGRSLDPSCGPIPTRMFSRLLKLWNWQLQRETTASRPGFEDEAA